MPQGLEDVCERIVMATFRVRVVFEAGTKEWQSNAEGWQVSCLLGDASYTDNPGLM